jgi:RHS repeat-associated protein
VFAAAKKEMDSLPMVFSGGEGVLSLAADPELSENSRQGFETKNAALRLSFELRNSTTALGIAGTLALEGVRKNDRARYYSPAFGRFVSEDKIRLEGGINFYSYVFNSPTNARDPSGLSWTMNIGGSGGCSWGANGNGGGFVIDSCGNFGSYTEYGGGSAVGAGCTFGLNSGLSNAHTFLEYTGTAGFGASGSGSMYTGFDTDNTPVVGGSLTIGGGVGAAATLGVTNTTVTPLFGRKTKC